ncbi:Protein SDA1-like protein [Rhynchospora pubera]|uniref:Protein SDA1 n=1 Tax=Rhynchospora pubera TaxID=906938 RepID=A0AAV8DB21_9POAL|nr:Protein SDA1-like protein [Rhynchospora pubera]
MAPPPASSATFLSPESVSAAGLGADRLNLPLLQSKMKADPSLYEPELQLLSRHFESSLDLFRHQAALNPTSDPVVAKSLGDLAMVLAHLTPFYPGKLDNVPRQIAGLLGSDGRDLPSSLRLHLVQALILLVNRKVVGLEETLELFMNLQLIGDRALRKLAFSHIVHSIRRMNKKHKNETQNRKLQNILFPMLQSEDELRAKRALTVICELHRRKVWFDERTANAICYACFHSSSRIMVASLSFLLGYENIEVEDDSDASSSDDDESSEKPVVLLSKEDVYKANKKGTTASKKKKKAKLKRVVRSMKRQQRIATDGSGSNYYSPLTYLKDAQGFAEKLLSHHASDKKNTERFEVKMMRLRVICRTVALHRLILLELYDNLANYAQPHQRDVTILLAAIVQACHDMVPPDAVEPLFKKIVNNFVNDRATPEAITVGLNTIREICLRMPLLMNEDLLQDLVLYKKTRNKGVSMAARSLITLFREICPSLLVKKDRGRPMNPNARPKAYGETTVVSDVPGLELLQGGDISNDDDDDEDGDGEDDDEIDEEYDNDVGDIDGGSSADGHDEDDVTNAPSDEEQEEEGGHSKDESEDDLVSSGNDDDELSDDNHEDEDDSDNDDEDDSGDEGSHDLQEKGRSDRGEKRKLDEYISKISAADASLRALKKLAMAKAHASEEANPILSNEDFKRIKEIKAKKQAEEALVQHGVRRINTDKPLNPAKLEVHVRRKLTKEERLELARAAREEREPYIARTKLKHKKNAGLSNAQKEHKKIMPLAARRAKASKSRQQRKKKQNRAGKQFRGRKAWK